MAKHYNRRQRKKLGLGEFKKWGFWVSWQFVENTPSNVADNIVERFIDEVIEANQLIYESAGNLRCWEGLVYSEKHAEHCTPAHRQCVQHWLEKHQLREINVSEIFDLNEKDFFSEFAESMSNTLEMARLNPALNIKMNSNKKD